MHGATDQATLRVVAVLVTYRRPELLVAALDALAGQTRAVDAVVVIDNGSGDGSARIAREHGIGADVLELPRNTGGAGGFAGGMAWALERHAADLLWLMDDDTVPTPSALEELLRARDGYDGPVAALASRVVWTDGTDHPMNTPRRRPFATASEIRRAAAVGAVPVRSMSFVSMLVDARAVRAAGLPVADYFLWNDDFEYSARLLRRATGLYVPASRVEHRTARLVRADADPGPRFFFEVRNKTWLLSRSPALRPVERLLYAGSSAVRWVRTAARAADRGELLRAGVRGLGQGLVRAPRQNVEALGGLGDLTRLVGAVEGRAVAHAEPPDEVGEGFSVVLPVYHADRARHVRRALDSVTIDQVLPPDQLVVVEDGPVRPKVRKAVRRLERHSDVPVTVVRLARNLGLARALQVGLAACKYDIVARADADDVSLPERFAVQVPLVRAGYDLVGSAITEFVDDEQELGVVRRQPQSQAEITRYARFHDPFNHPSVVYRRRAVDGVGGYEHLALLEDYLLFARMIASGARVTNVPDSLVLYRTGAGAYARRGGRRLLTSEIRLQRTLRAEGFISAAQYVRNLVLRGGYRLVPEGLRRRAYRLVVLGRGHRGGS